MWKAADVAGPRMADPGCDFEGGKTVHGWMNSWDWVWMSFMMAFWIVVLGAVVYAAVRLAQRPPRKDH
jgi:hypothetical protein